MGKKISTLLRPKGWFSGPKLNSKIILNSLISMLINYPIYSGTFKSCLDYPLNQRSKIVLNNGILQKILRCCIHCLALSV